MVLQYNNLFDKVANLCYDYYTLSDHIIIGGYTMVSNQSNTSLLLSQIITEVIALCPNVNQTQLRMKIAGILSLYDVRLSQLPNINSDIKEKIQLFLSAKKLEGLADSTLKSYQLELKIFAEKITNTIDNITTTDIRLFLGEFPHLKMSSVSKKLSVLKSFFGWLTDEEIIEKDPTRKIKTPKKEKRMPKSLTIEELEILRESCVTLRERALMEVLYATGGRLSEIQQLNRNDINWYIRSAKVVGKGDKEREIYFSFKAMYHLKKYLKSRDDLVPALFITERKPYRRLSNRGIQREINKIAKRSGIDKNVHPHLFRSTMATLTLNNGASLSAIQSLLGHSRPDTTQLYCQISDEVKREQYNKYLVQ